MRSTKLLSIACCLLLIGISAKSLAGPTNDVKLNRIASSIHDVLKTVDNDIEQASLKLAGVKFDDPKVSTVLSDLCRGHRYSIDCAVIDAGGTIVAVEPDRYHGVIGKNVENQSQVKRLERTDKPVMSRIFKAVEGSYVVAVQWPIQSKNGKLKGLVSMIFNPEPFIKKIVKPELSRDLENVWVMQSDGQVLYSRYRETIGDCPMNDDSFTGDRSLLSAIRTATERKEGSKIYRERYIGRADPKEKELRWTTIKLHDAEWRIILFGKPKY